MILRQGFEPQVSIVDGIGGEIEFEMGASGNTRIIGDLSGFISHPLDNEIIYHPVANNSDPVLTSDNITVYPSLRIMGSGGSTPTGQRIVSIPHDFTVNGNLRIDNNAILRMHSGDHGNIRVMGDVRVAPDGRAGKLEFPLSGSAKSLFVQGNITVGGSETSQGEDAEIRVLNNNPSSTLHTLETRGNIGLTRYGKINLHSDNTGGNNVNLLVTGNPNKKFYKFTGEDTGNPSATLHSIEINKGNNHNSRFSIDTMLTIAGGSNGLEKPVRLISGGLVLNHPELDITLSSGGADFVISGNTGLIINRGIARITAPGSSGLYLDGYIELAAQNRDIRGQLILNGGTGSDNYLEYSSSGRARIEIRGG